MALSSLPLPRRRRGACPAGNPATLKGDLDAVLAHNAALGRALLEARQDKDRHERAAAEAQAALDSYREGMRAAHAELARDNIRLRACGLLAAADMIEHNIDGRGLDFPDAAAAAEHFRKLAAGIEKLTEAHA